MKMDLKIAVAIVLLTFCQGQMYRCPSKESNDRTLKSVVVSTSFKQAAMTVPLDFHMRNHQAQVDFVHKHAKEGFYPSLMPFVRKKLDYCHTGDHHKLLRYKSEVPELCPTSLQYECLENDDTGDIVEFCGPIKSCKDREHYFVHYDLEQPYVVYLQPDECLLGSFVNSCYDKEGCVPNIAYCISESSPKTGQCNVQEGFCHKEGKQTFSLEEGYNYCCKISQHSCPDGEGLLQDCSCAPKCPTGLYRVGNSTCLWLGERPRDTSGTMNGTGIFEPHLPTNTSVKPVENTTKAPDIDVSKPPSNQGGSSHGKSLSTIALIVALCIVGVVCLSFCVGIAIYCFCKKNDVWKQIINKGCKSFNITAETVVISSGLDCDGNLDEPLRIAASVADGSDCALLDETQP